MADHLSTNVSGFSPHIDTSSTTTNMNNNSDSNNNFAPSSTVTHDSSNYIDNDNNNPYLPQPLQSPVDGVNDPDVFFLTKIAAALSLHIYHPLTPVPPHVTMLSLSRIIHEYGLSSSTHQIIHEDDIIGAPRTRLYSYTDPLTQIQYWICTTRGSQDRDDWIHNALQLVGQSKHFTDSALIAKELSRIALTLKIQLIFTGHSKGGCHAVVQSLATARWAITFNAPGVSPQTKAALRRVLGYESLFNDRNIYSFTTSLDVISGGFEALNRNKIFISTFINLITGRDNPEFVAMMNHDRDQERQSETVDMTEEINRSAWSEGSDPMVDQFIFQPPNGQHQFTIVAPTDENLLSSTLIKLGINLLFSSNRTAVIMEVLNVIREQHSMESVWMRLSCGFDFFIQRGEMEMVERGQPITSSLYRQHAYYNLDGFLIKRI